MLNRIAFRRNGLGNSPPNRHVWTSDLRKRSARSCFSPVAFAPRAESGTLPVFSCDSHQKRPFRLGRAPPHPDRFGR